MSNLIPLFLVSLVMFHRPAQFLPTSKPQFPFGKLEKLYLHSSPSPSFKKGGDVRKVLFTVVGFGCALSGRGVWFGRAFGGRGRCLFIRYFDSGVL